MVAIEKHASDHRSPDGGEATDPDADVAVPTPGVIYRDKSDRSFVVLAINRDVAIAEYADGDFARIALKDWADMAPHKAEY